jgi:hypothetical protein
MIVYSQLAHMSSIVRLAETKFQSLVLLLEEADVGELRLYTISANIIPMDTTLSRS